MSSSLSSSSSSDFFAIGIEGGIELVADQHFESGYVCILDQNGREGFGTSARYVIAPHLIDRLQSSPTLELGDIIDELTNKKDVRQREGMMGLITLGHLPRAECYVHGVIFALAPFVSDRRFWE